MSPLGLRQYGFIALLAAITLISPLSIHFFLPAMPAIKEAFAVSEATAQFTFSVAMFTMAAATLVYGSLSDRVGRKPALLGGIALFVAGALVCALAGDIETLIAGRLVQAAGAACGLVLARAIARDVFGLDGLVRVIAYLTMAYVMGPMLSPPIGGALVDGFGWRSIFWAASSAGAVLLALSIFVVPETRTAPPAGSSAVTILGGYARLFASARFTCYVFQSGLTTGAFFAQAAASSFVMREVLERPASEFGLYFMFFPAGYLTGNFIASRLSGRVAIDTMVLAGSTMTLGAAVALAVTVFLVGPSPLGIFVPGMFLTLSQGLSLPNSQTGAIGVDRNLAGTASGIGVFMQMFCGAVGSQLTGLLADGTAEPMARVVLVFAAASLAVAAMLFLGRIRGQPA